MGTESLHGKSGISGNQPTADLNEEKLYLLIGLTAIEPKNPEDFLVIYDAVRDIESNPNLDETLRDSARRSVAELIAEYPELFSAAIELKNSQARERISELSGIKPDSFEKFVEVYMAYSAMGGDLTLQDRVRVASENARVQLTAENPGYFERYLQLMAGSRVLLGLGRTAATVEN